MRGEEDGLVPQQGAADAVVENVLRHLCGFVSGIGVGIGLCVLCVSVGW